jgi:hypothetical protein
MFLIIDDTMGIRFASIVKSDDGENMVFDSMDHAEEFASENLGSWVIVNMR